MALVGASTRWSALGLLQELFRCFQAVAHATDVTNICQDWSETWEGCYVANGGRDVVLRDWPNGPHEAVPTSTENGRMLAVWGGDVANFVV
jgi:hypothetical protein